MASLNISSFLRPNLALRSLYSLPKQFNEVSTAIQRCHFSAIASAETTTKGTKKPESVLLLGCGSSNRRCMATTLNTEELNKFENLSGKWWNEDGELRPLHSLNALRVPLVRDGLISLSATSVTSSKGPHPLEGLKILDIGCGGGILTEPLARLGAHVKGLDPVMENIKAAEAHLRKDPSIQDRVQYECGTAEELALREPSQYDAVVASEVVEHVDNLSLFLQSCVNLLKTEGSLFITTINQTWLSYILGIIGAEWALGIVPRGTHSWDKFVSPKDLRFALESYGCQTSILHGMCYNPLRNRWSWTRDTSVNYALQVFKRSSSQSQQK